MGEFMFGLEAGRSNNGLLVWLMSLIAAKVSNQRII
jgi:hypothetical protein